MDIIAKLKDSNFLGRGGASFPTGQKWESVKKELAEKKYIVCNSSEGEPGVFKDRYIWENYPEEVVNGIKIALETIDNSQAIIYLNKNYFEKFETKLKNLIRNSKITLFKKNVGYLGGEETVLCNVIEGKIAEPRQKPPFPSQSGIFNYPTLINNVETFYYVSQIAKDQYKKTRFFCITGEGKNKGVFELPENLTIEEVLKQTDNYPSFDFFIQVGGGASGEFLLANELNQPVKGASTILIFNKKETDPVVLMERIADFFHKENCDRCVPCREGAYRILEMAKNKKINKETLNDLYFVLEKTSFCPLGRSIPSPFRSLINKLI